MRKISMFLIATVFLLLSSIHAQTTLNPGDLVIVTANADGSDNFDFIPLVDLDAGTIIKFTDNGLNTSNVLMTTEGTITWTASSAVTKGTVVSFSGTAGGDWALTGSYAIGASGDNLLVYQGDAATPSFIYGVGWGKSTVWAYTGSTDSNIPAALSVANKTIVQLLNLDNYQYNGPTSGTAAQLLAMVAYPSYWVGNDATAYTAYATAFSITATESCTAPYALTASGITSSSASLGWSSFGTEVLWEIEYGVTGFVQGTGTTVTGVANPYSVSGLTQNTVYQFYVKADCGGGDLSSWAGPFSFTTPYSCPKPTVPTVTNITSVSADLGWTNGGSETAWIVYYKTAAAADYTEVTGVTTNPYTLNGLTSATNYIFKVKANCAVSDTSFVSVTKTFTTLCGVEAAPTTVQDFASYTGTAPNPVCWNEATGALAASSVLTIANSKWLNSTGFANTGSNVGVKINLYGTSNDWFISQSIDLGATPSLYRVSYKYAVTSYNSTTTQSTLGTHKVNLVVSTDGGTTWSNANSIKEYTGAATYSSSGATEVVNLTGFSGVIKIAFVAATSSTSPDIDFHIDDFKVESIPSCLAPTALTATAVTATGATLGWTAGGTETLWNVEYGVTGFVQGAGTMVTGVTNPYSLTGLTQNTVYQYYVNADCGGGDLSTWAGPFSFTTPYSCPKPTVPTVTNITSVSADLGWTNGGSETAWIVYYKTAAAADYTEVTGVTTNPYTLNGLTSATNYIFKVKANCAVSDTSFVSVTKTFTTPCDAITTFPYTESFSSPLSSCWAVSEAAPGATYHWAPATSDATHGVIGPKAGTNFMALNVFNAAIANNPYYLTTPNFTLDGTTKQINYYYYLGNSGYKTTPVPLTVQISTDNGLTWVDLYAHTSANSTFSTTSALTGWIQNKVTLAAYANQTVQFRFASNSNYSSGFCNQAIDEFILEDAPSCISPSALTATAVTAAGATLGWTAGGTETLWNVEYGVTGFVQGAGTTVTGVTNPYILTGLTQNTVYQFYVKADCGGETSTWAGPFSFSTPYSCPKPTVPTVANITTVSADLGWTNGGTETAWTVYYKTAAAVDYTEITGITTNPYTISGLSSGTSYIYKVKANCSVSDTSFVSDTKTFNTLCAAITTYPHSEPFDTYLPSVCWTEGDAGDLTAGPTTISPTAASWAADGFVNVGSTGAAKINIDGIIDNDWLISPELSIPATPNFRLKYSVGVTQWNSTNAPTTAWESDDFVEVLVTTTYPTNWTVLKTYNDLNTPSHLGQVDILDLSAYAGQNVYFAFRGVEGASNGSADIDFSIDNFIIEAVPTCEAPTALTATALTATDATLGWTAGASETTWNVEYGVTGFVQGAGTIVTGVANPYLLTGLTQNTTYQFYVKADCGGDLSTWAGPFSFTTPYSCPKPTVPTVANITSVSADLGWTNGGSETAWIVYYKTAADVDYTEVTGVTTNPYTLGGLSSATSYIFKVKANCSVSDTSNVSTTKTFNTLCNSASIPTVSQGFEATTLPICWSTGLVTGTTNWASTTTNDGVPTPHTGSYFMGKSYSTSDALIYSQPIDMTTSTSDARVNVWIYRSASNFNTDRIRFHINTTQSLTGATQLLEIFPLTTVAPTVAAAGWYQYLVNIPNTFNTNSTVYIIAQGTTSGGYSSYGIGFDDFKVESIPTCEAPSALTASALTATGATLGWTAGGTETAWNIEYGVTGFAQGTGTTVTGVANPYILTGLAQNTTYQFYVKADCGGGDLSAWSDPFSFTTAFTCPKPTALNTANITVNSADLGWTAGGTETAWIVYYKTAAATDYTEVTGVTTNPYTLGGLNASTTYMFKVKANCSASDTSYTSSVFAFNTNCDVVSSISENFDLVSTPNLPNCWSKYISPSFTYQTVETSTSTAYSSPNKVELYNSGANTLADAPLLISPMLSNLGAGTNQLRFYAKSTMPTLIVGTMTDPADASTFVPLTTVTGITNTWNEYVVSFASYTGAAEYFAFQHPVSSTYSYVYLDDVNWEVIPTCIKPTALTATDNTLDGATLGWTAGGTETLWNIEYGAPGFIQGTGTTITGVTNPYILNGLAASSSYQYYVKADCGGGDLSIWSQPFSFNTLCSSVDIPYTQNFDGVTAPALPVCMSITNDNADLKMWNTSINGNSAPNSMRISYNGSLAMNDWFYTPGLNLIAGNTYTLKFNYRSSGTLYPEKLEVKFGDAANAAAMTSAQVFNNSSILTNTYEQGTGSFTVSTSGVYYVGFHGYSDVNMNYLDVDDISITIPSAAAEILTYTIPNQVSSTVNTGTATDGTVDVVMPFGTDVTALVPTITVSTDATINPLSGVAQDFTGGTVSYVVTAEAANTKAWIVNLTVESYICVTPTALEATNVTETTATLGWTSTAANFNVRYRVAGASAWIDATAASNSLALTMLTGATTYEFEVQAICSATPGDNSAWATAVEFTTLTPATCETPTALVVSAINAAGATLNWTNGGAETAWNIRYKKTADATYTNVTNTTTKPYILTTLQANSAYVWNVQAVCSSTLSSTWSIDNTFTTTVGIESNSLSGLTVYSFDSQINVTNNGNVLVKAVVIYDMIGQEVGTYIINSTDNILVNTNLVIGTYMVKVITADKVGTYKLFIK